MSGFRSKPLDHGSRTLFVWFAPFDRWLRKKGQDARLDVMMEQIDRNPESGDVLVGDGGVRKIRVARIGGGKSGGFRVAYYPRRSDGTVFLLAGFAKSAQPNFTAADVAAFATLIDRLETASVPRTDDPDGGE